VRISVLPNEIKFLIMGHLNTEEMVRAAAIPGLADVVAAILARGGLGGGGEDLFPIEDEFNWVSSWSDKHWEHSFDLTETLPGGVLHRLCQVADVAIEVAIFRFSDISDI